jgi:hypothetical protein
MTKADTLKLQIGDLVYCTLKGIQGWYVVADKRVRDGCIKIDDIEGWYPPRTFTQTQPKRKVSVQ